MNLSEIIKTPLRQDEGIWRTETGGYWSTLDRDDMDRYLEDLPRLGVKGVVEAHFPHLEDIVFSPKRVGGIGLMDIQPGEVVIDAGCMWGGLTVPTAKSGCHMISFDQTYSSLKFLKARLAEERLENVNLVQTDLNAIEFHPASVDKVIVNGVLEWLAEGDIEAASLWAGKTEEKGTKRCDKPRDIQLAFLKKLHGALKPGGQIYLAIENRLDVVNFFGARDPHTGQRFVTFLPRGVQNFLSKLVTKRPYRAWIYTEAELVALFKEAGFGDVEMRYAFPDYRYPELILTKKGMELFRPVRYVKAASFKTKLFWYGIEKFFYKWLRMTSVAPSLIALAKKDASSS